jgi:cellulose biosynthesis protein BcsQ
LRGGIGKTTLSFNLCFLADDVLAVDTCPQGNLSFFFINRYKGIKPKNQVKSRTEPPTLKAAQT